jgi:hypothetical protein
MCLLCKVSDKFISDSDITVWKMVLTDREKWTGPYMHTRNVFGFDEAVKACDSPDNPGIAPVVLFQEQQYYRLDGGVFHSYLNEHICRGDFDRLESIIYDVKHHCSGDKGELARKFGELCICRCTIPEGTVCYKDDEEIASEEIIVHKPENL